MYESFYRLREKPFSLLPDTDYLYLSRKHGTALALLEYSLLTQDGFCVISGEAGVGKTTLIRRLLAAHADRITMGLITSTQGSFGDLLGWISLAFHLECHRLNRSQLYEELQRFLAEQAARGRPVVLIVDEAQNIPAAMLDELRVLAKDGAGSGRPLKTILVGQPRLRNVLRAAGLDQSVKQVAVDYHIGPLSREETSEYIRHRLSVAGGDPGIFDEEACDAVFHYTGGVPRLANLLCHNVMASAYALKRAAIGADIVHSVMQEREARGMLPQFGVRPAARGGQSVVRGTVAPLPGDDGSGAGVSGRLVSIDSRPRSGRVTTTGFRVSGLGDPVTEPNRSREAEGEAAPPPGQNGEEEMANYQMTPATVTSPRMFWGTAILLGFIAGLLVAVIVIGAVYLEAGRRAAPAVPPRAAAVAPAPLPAASISHVTPPAVTPAVTAVVRQPGVSAAEKGRLKELISERNAAMAEARALQTARDTALAMAKARERAAQAELQAALEQERVQAVLRHQQKMRDRRRKVVVQLPQPVRLVSASPVKLPAPVAGRVPPVSHPAPVSAGGVVKFSPNPCNGPAAKFLSTCKE